MKTRHDSDSVGVKRVIEDNEVPVKIPRLALSDSVQKYHQAFGHRDSNSAVTVQVGTSYIQVLLL